jgi:hypothetical protein
LIEKSSETVNLEEFPFMKKLATVRRPKGGILGDSRYRKTPRILERDPIEGSRFSFNNEKLSGIIFDSSND